jgi:hypothetical protein
MSFDDAYFNTGRDYLIGERIVYCGKSTPKWFGEIGSVMYSDGISAAIMFDNFGKEECCLANIKPLVENEFFQVDL